MKQAGSLCVVWTILLAGLGSPAALAQPAAPSTPGIDVVKPPEKGVKIPIALAPFAVKGLSGADAAKKEQEIRDILAHDLEFSGLFALHTNQQLIRDLEAKDRRSGKVDYAEWRRLGVDAVVKGEYEPRAQGFAIRFQIYHVGDSLYVGGQEIKAPDQNVLRQGVHKVSDEVQFRLTGEKGISRTRLAFIREEGRKKELYLVDYDGHDSTLRRITRDEGIALFPSWHPSGNGIAFTSYVKHNPDLYLLDFEKRQRLPLSVFPGVNYGSSFHPGGKRLLASLSKDGNPEIYELTLGDLQNPRRLTNHPGVDCSPAYSSDGNRILFTSSRAGVPRIHVMDASGGNVRPLTSGRYDDAAVWSPREDLIAYVSQTASNQFDVYLVRPDGGEATRVTGGRGDNQSPEFSPDGRHLVFSSNRDGRYQLYAYHLYEEDKDRQTVRLTWVSGNCTSPAWSPN